MSQDAVTLLCGDAIEVLRTLPDESVRCCVTSPPYWGLRDYGVAGQIGLEDTPEEYVGKLVEVFREVRRVLKNNGTLWVNIGDTYNAYNGGSGPSSSLSQIQSRERPQLQTGYGLRCKALKPKDLIGIPWTVAFALRADGWWLRRDVIWHKPNPMPESVIDRPTTAHEYLFLLSTSERYYYTADAIREPDSGQDHARHTLDGQPSLAPPGQQPHRGIRTTDGRNGRGRNKRSVWTIQTQPFAGAHFAVMPEALATPCVLAGSREGDVVLDPFCGAGTVGVMALRYGRQFIGIDLNQRYIDELARPRIAAEQAQCRLPLTMTRARRG